MSSVANEFLEELKKFINYLFIFFHVAYVCTKGNLSVPGTGHDLKFECHLLIE